MFRKTLKTYFKMDFQPIADILAKALGWVVPFHIVIHFLLFEINKSILKKVFKVLLNIVVLYSVLKSGLIIQTT